MTAELAPQAPPGPLTITLDLSDPRTWLAVAVYAESLDVSGGYAGDRQADELRLMLAERTRFDVDGWAAHAQAMCRLCGCTENSACDDGCSWVDDPAGLGYLCSVCLPRAGDPPQRH